MHMRIVSRKSQLALRQSEWIQAKLTAHNPLVHVSIIGLQTVGDTYLDAPLARLGGKGLFISALEDYLLAEQADIAVHSLKDMPYELPTALTIGAIPERMDPRDAWISWRFPNIASLPSQARIGTSSLRRQAQLLAIRPDLQMIPLRGNIETRVRKLEEGQFEGIILAACGLMRLGLTPPICTPFSVADMLPAVGQGALAVEHRVGDPIIATHMAALHHEPSAQCVTAERAMLRVLKGGCATPIAGLATHEKGQLRLRAMVGSPDGSQIIRAEDWAAPEQMMELGQAVAEQLLAQGAERLLGR